MIMRIPILKAVLKAAEWEESKHPSEEVLARLEQLLESARLEKKEKARDYKQEYRDYHCKPKQIKERAERNTARSKLGLKVGDPREADHKQPLSQGGSNSKRNLRAVSRSTNRHKADKRE